VQLRRSRLVLAACGIAMFLPIGACGNLTGGYPDPGTADVAGIGSAPPAGDIAGVGSTVATPAAETDTSTWDTKWGPLSAADRLLLTKVRLATLWEMVMAQQASQRGNSARVREISAMIASQHEALDKQDRDLAAKFRVQLPVKPSDTQQEWMADITSKTGKEYDETYVKWLRFAHGQIFGLIGQVRGTTQNTLMRRFAEQCNKAVLGHQQMLESTGLTTPDSFPPPPDV
jgi:Predicted outer membrane protein